jgi:tRNA G18 (ribose-2'-O)-methylase SpoU
MTGASHSSVKRYRDLARNPHTNGLERELLLDGVHLVVEARTAGMEIESAAFDQDSYADPALRRIAEQLVADGADVYVVSRRTLESMSPVKTPAGVVAIARHSMVSLDAALTARNRLPLVVVAHDVQDPGNVGGIVRSAEAAGATAFVSSPSSADPLSWKGLRGSMGSALRLPIARAEIGSTLRALRDAGIAATALTPHGGTVLFEADLRGPTALILGGEGSGLPADVLQTIDQCVSIPMHTPVESLNVGIAAALVLYEAYRQRHEP